MRIYNVGKLVKSTHVCNTIFYHQLQTNPVNTLNLILNNKLLHILKIFEYGVISSNVFISIFLIVAHSMTYNYMFINVITIRGHYLRMLLYITFPIIFHVMY